MLTAHLFQHFTTPINTASIHGARQCRGNTPAGADALPQCGEGVHGAPN